MSKAQLTLNIAHNNPKGIHQESFQWEFEVKEDGNWIQSFMDYINNKENKDEPAKPEIIK